MGSPPVYNADVYKKYSQSEHVEAEAEIYVRQYAEEGPPAALPPTADDFHQEFFIRISMLELKSEPLPQLTSGRDATKDPQKGQIQLLGKEFAQARWGMARDFATRLKPGAKLGGASGLTGSSADKPVQAYALEALDPQHRLADMRLLFRDRVFATKFPANFNQKTLIFLMWMHEFTVRFPDEVKKIAKTLMPNLPEETYDAFVGHGVKYLDFNPGDIKKSTSAELMMRMRARFQCLLWFQGGKIWQAGKKLFDTTRNHTHFSGAGWAIFVVSPSGMWYAGSHVVGKFQHSSFLGGRPVKSAGEIQVFDGIPCILTAKSGHYQPNMEQVLSGVKSLHLAGVSLSVLKVRLKEKTTSRWVEVQASDFMNDSALRNKHNVW